MNLGGVGAAAAVCLLAPTQAEQLAWTSCPEGFVVFVERLPFLRPSVRRGVKELAEFLLLFLFDIFQTRNFNYSFQ